MPKKGVIGKLVWTEKTAYEHITGLIEEITNNIWRIAKNGVPDDNIKLKANCKLLDKILPDKSQTQIQLNQDSPLEVLLQEIREIKLEKLDK